VEWWKVAVSGNLFSKHASSRVEETDSLGCKAIRAQQPIAALLDNTASLREGDNSLGMGNGGVQASKGTEKS